MGGNYKYRHWGCVTERQFANMSVALGGDITQIKGWDDLDNEDMAMVQEAFKIGRGECASWLA